MAYDLDKIKEQLARISGQSGKSNLWRPEPAPPPGNSYEIRVVPWPDGGQPFKERAFYYNIAGGRAILAPFQFDKPDPIQKLIEKLRQSEAFDKAKEFYPRRRYYAPVIVRGKEEEGVKIWAFSKTVCTALLQKMLGDFGDITDVKEGRDVTVKMVQEPGRAFPTTTAEPRIKTTPLGSVKQIKDWTSSVPSLDDIYKLMPYDEIEKRMNDHLTGGTGDSDGTEKTVERSSAAVSDKESMDIDSAFSQMDDIVENG